MSHGGNARAAAVAADYSRGAASSKGGVQGKFTKSSGVETGVSRAQKLLEKSLAGKKSQESGPSGDEQPGVTKRSAQWSPELEAKRKHMLELLEQTPAAACVSAFQSRLQKAVLKVARRGIDDWPRVLSGGVIRRQVAFQQLFVD